MDEITTLNFFGVLSLAFWIWIGYSTSESFYVHILGMTISHVTSGSLHLHFALCLS